mgnify:CR=1 FL=1
MKYWHIQLHPGNKEAFPPKKVIEILKKTSYIGLGDWEEGKKQINDFKKMNIGDIVAVKSGQTPVALVQVIGDYEYLNNTNRDYDWFENRRKVKVLDYYKKEYDFHIPQPRGTLSLCADLTTETSKTIINWHKKILNKMKTEEIKNILLHKFQVILQGPPGTGKTREAKLVAEELIKTRTIGNPENIVDSFIKKFDSKNEYVKIERENRKKLLSTFNSLFPRENLKNLSLEKYCIGRDNKENFCWWLERGLQPLGYYFPGSSRSYLIYWSKANEDYSKHGFIKDIESNEEAMKKIADLLHKVVETKDPSSAIQLFGDSFLVKLLNSYYPDEFFPINSERMIENALKIFKIEFNGLDIFQKNKKLNQVYLEKKKQFNSDIDSFEFAKILYGNFNLKTGEVINTEKEIVANGKWEIIQFHPAYSYEDFVRGIVADTDDNGNISYRVENKILADFAETAKDSPNDNFVLIIDEINRANLSAVLGELIYALEYRNEAISSMYEYNNDKNITLPKNLFIIGTMNTADRSVGHIDYAIRRRFAFIDILPNEAVITNPEAKSLFREVSNLFSSDFLSPDFNKKDIMIGHSYFLVNNIEELKIKLEYEIKPILREYLKDGIFVESVSEKIEALNV